MKINWLRIFMCYIIGLILGSGIYNLSKPYYLILANEPFPLKSISGAMRLFGEYLHQSAIQGTPDAVQNIPRYLFESKEENMHRGK